ncbi:MAG TPA: electron transfer flavoprotein subunit beta/FixA family protein [Syntrophomonadaceae bacterium]|nr:electron transfer flavoprotein subunit beta/FixA family protein [Syntrophomonadaceae bacterium]
MNIVVAIKQVPDVQQIRIRNRKPVLDGVPYTIGKIDKNALEAGVQLKEATGDNLIALSVGNEEVEETIKEALAAGADEAYLVIDDKITDMDSAENATLLAAAIKKIDNMGVLLFGEGSSDNYSGQVSSRVAELLGLPQIGYASQITLEGETARITRQLEDGEEVLEVLLPVVVSVLGDVNEPRIPSVTQILKAGRKPKEILELDDLDVELSGEKMVSTLTALAPEADRKQISVNSVGELVSALHSEGFIGR